MKVLRKTDIVRLRQVEHVNAERYILSRVQHPFVVDLFATFQDSLNVYMLMSYVPGALTCPTTQSTVLKQMKLIHHGGYNEQERDSYKEIIYSNTIQSMR